MSFEARFKQEVNSLVRDRRFQLGVGCILAFLLIYGISKSSESVRRLELGEARPDFKNGSILGRPQSDFYKSKERSFSKTASTILDSQKTMQERLNALENKLKETQSQATTSESDGTQSGAEDSVPKVPSEGVPDAETQPDNPTSGVTLHPAPGNFQIGMAGGYGSSRKPWSVGEKQSRSGPSVIAFPVKLTKPKSGVALPVGSYVKAKLMTGVAAPEGKTYPSLLVLDYSYVSPNKSRVDLSGCFMIAKAQGDLSTERVQMQATKLSCVSSRGKMFERDVNGFVADDRDNAFAIKGEVQSKQGRVMAMAFLSSVVEGVSKAIQQAQTTQQTNPLGGSQSVLTEDQGKYIAAGGAANASSMVAQWYLNQAQNLLPTISVGSGRDVWVIMQETVDLPNEYFKKNRRDENASIYSYLSRLVD